MLLVLALSPSSSITFRNCLGFVNVVSAPISVKVAPVSFWPAAGKYQLQIMVTTQRVTRKKRFGNDVILVRNIIDEALITGLIIQGYCVENNGMSVNFYGSKARYFS